MSFSWYCYADVKILVIGDVTVTTDWRLGKQNVHMWMLTESDKAGDQRRL